MPVIGADRRAHLSERCSHPLHGPGPKALVTRQRAGERRRRQDPDEQSHGGARVSAIERSSRHMELIPSLALDYQLGLALTRINLVIDREPGGHTLVPEHRTPSLKGDRKSTRLNSSHVEIS